MQSDRVVSLLEREAIAAAKVADFVDELDAVERDYQPRQPLTVGQRAKLRFLKHLVSRGKVGQG